jgi:mono/diheme cytochrome c family protein
MVLRSIIFSIFLLLLTGCGEGSVAEQSDVDKHTNRSEELYNANCAACHGFDGKLGAGGASDLSSSTLGREEILNVIKEGRKGMPPHDHISTDDRDFQDLADLIIKMREE